MNLYYLYAQSDYWGEEQFKVSFQAQRLAFTHNIYLQHKMNGSCTSLILGVFFLFSFCFLSSTWPKEVAS